MVTNHFVRILNDVTVGDGNSLVGMWYRYILPEQAGGSISASERRNRQSRTEQPTMLFLSYWKISEDVETREILEGGRVLMESGMWPPDDVEVIRWDGTVDNWGITLMEADNYEAVNRAWALWRAAVPGMFERAKTAPAAPVEEAIEQTGAVLEELPTQD